MVRKCNPSPRSAKSVGSSTSSRRGSTIQKIDVRGADTRTTTGARTYSCPRCGFVMEDKYSYKIHLKKSCPKLQ